MSKVDVHKLYNSFVAAYSFDTQQDLNVVFYVSG